MVASVVVLPLPVGPVMTIMPCGSFNSRRSVVSSAARKSELFDDQQPAILGQDTDDRGFAVLGRHDRDTDVDVGAPDPQPRRAVLRQPPFGDVEAGDDLDAGDHGLRQHAGGRRDRPQQAVDRACRTTRPVGNGSMWMSLARSSTAFSSRSLTARTTGAPLARSRRLSMSSSRSCWIRCAIGGVGLVVRRAAGRERRQDPRPSPP